MFFENVRTLTIHSVTQNALVKRVKKVDYDADFLVNDEPPSKMVDETQLIITIIWND